MKKLFYFLLVFPLFINGQSTSQNFIKTTTYKKPNLLSVTSPTPDVATVQVTYFDGLGRPIQQIANQQSGSGMDIIVPIVYDNYGLQAREYLPYSSTGMSMSYDASAVANVTNYSLYAGQTPYAEKKFEDSPLNRVQKQAAPGNDWDMPILATDPDNTVKTDYQNNTSADQVQLYTGYSTWNATNGLYDISLTQNGSTYYSGNQLYKTVIKNENWKSTDGKNNTTEEYRNKTGLLILTRTYSDYKDSNGTLVTSQVAHDTYYVFDQFNNLIYTIPPLVTNITTQMDGLCYQYKYDYRNRLVEKKLPGKQWEYIVYDKLNRVVATGPAFAPFTDLQTIPPAIPIIGWLITKYDLYNRPIYTGWQQVNSITTSDRKLLQDAQNNLTTSINETKQKSGTIDGIAAYYSNNVAPTSFKLLSVNYYDNYAFPNGAAIPTLVETQSILTTSQVKTLPTGSWNRILTTAASLTGETTSVFYDPKGRVVETYLANYLGGYTKTDVKVDFVGVQQYTITYHKRLATDSEIKVTDNYTYTPQGRLLTHTHQIGSGTIQLLSKNDYNEIGQLITKRVGGTDITGTTSLQKVDYAYNIRGWLTDINDVNDLKIATENDLFAFKLSYNTVTNAPNSNSVSLYNGNISEAYWRTQSDNIKRKYSYEYDNLNRLKNAIYQKPDQATAQTNSYNEGMQYDKNGNIIALQRNGAYDDNLLQLQIDNLTYFYATNTNQLTKVTDATNNTNGFKDDSNGTNDTTDDYGYDLNGNMNKDENKKITSIKYNHLNLPTEIIFSNLSYRKINYIYNAAGVKLKKIVTNGTTAASVTTTDYLNGFQYLQSGTAGVAVLKFFPTSEGYVDNTVVSGVNTYNYVFNYTDHLGNVRLSYTKYPNSTVLTILSENHYYPFGLTHSGYNMTKLDYDAIQSGDTVLTFTPCTICPNMYMFNNKELQADLSLNNYDFGARNYDPAIGRWMNIDPLAENTTDVSPYVYGLNNPVFFVDSNGKEADDFVDQNDSNIDSTSSDFKIGDPPLPGQGTSDGNLQGHKSNGEPDGRDVIVGLDTVVIINASGFDGIRGNHDDRAGVDQRVDFDGYHYADGLEGITNAATFVWGATKLGVNQLRQVNLASSVGEAFGIGTQVAAPRLQAFTNTIGTLGNRVGIVGYGLSAAVLLNKVVTRQTISTSEKVAFGINSFFAGVAIATELSITVAFAPQIAAAALIYGGAELISYGINGQTLEQNILGK